MRDYARISPAFWTGRTGRALRRNPDAQRLALYLLTCPLANMIGVFYVAAPTICHEVGLAEDALPALWEVLEALDFAYYDADTEMAWVPNMAREQLDDVLKPGDRRVAGVVRQVDSIRRHRFARAFWERYAVPFSLASHPEAQGLVALFTPAAQGLQAVQSAVVTPSKPNTPIEEDQDQDQEQAQEQDPPQSPSKPSADGSQLAPRWERHKMPYDATAAFREVFARYPNQVGQAKAASAWCAILEAGFPGGEAALRRVILTRFEAGQLKWHPYAGDARYRPAFETYLREFRWLDADSAPDDPDPVKPAPSGRPLPPTEMDLRE